MSSEDSDTGPNLGTHTTDQGPIAPPAPPPTTDQGFLRRRYSTGVVVGVGLLGLVTGAVASAGVAIFMWALALGPPPPPPGPPGPAASQLGPMGWSHVHPPSRGIPRGPMPGGPPPPPPPGANGFRTGPPPLAPPPGKPPGPPAPIAPGQAPDGPPSPAPRAPSGHT